MQVACGRVGVACGGRWGCSTTSRISSSWPVGLAHRPLRPCLDSTYSGESIRPGRIHRDGFRGLWDGINAKRDFGWDVNPWVWPLTFRRTE